MENFYTMKKSRWLTVALGIISGLYIYISRAVQSISSLSEARTMSLAASIIHFAILIALVLNLACCYHLYFVQKQKRTGLLVTTIVNAIFFVVWIIGIPVALAFFDVYQSYSYTSGINLLSYVNKLETILQLMSLSLFIFAGMGIYHGIRLLVGSEKKQDS
ncbi:hypothetical protein M2475_000607 [Breznakia sp. PF5-3]|uniref:hypothetical protein n=1 Tax=unclassified Breznakia TaxID=2623764 RepID=UPI0024069D9B|nr:MULTISPECIES: hypothetical protein [unclassified Breznakia]MDF9824362.1 hypothetical protein [Breznakia sp. PM6-1]MDF9835047.1 hypothetical protein [Breznakia sp. PF5-3]MDF9837782.1 hypothetical protein [Breznakia sp. PFB2-8]MDF9859661.1 hypothetical protein [Breznakia sp. PH5-24]